MRVGISRSELMIAHFESNVKLINYTSLANHFVMCILYIIYIMLCIICENIHMNAVQSNVTCT